MMFSCSDTVFHNSWVLILINGSQCTPNQGQTSYTVEYTNKEILNNHVKVNIISPCQGHHVKVIIILACQGYWLYTSMVHSMSKSFVHYNMCRLSWYLALFEIK